MGEVPIKTMKYGPVTLPYFQKLTSDVRHQNPILGFYIQLSGYKKTLSFFCTKSNMFIMVGSYFNKLNLFITTEVWRGKNKLL